MCAFQGNALERKRCTLPFQLHPYETENWNAELVSRAGAAILDHNGGHMSRTVKYKMGRSWVSDMGEPTNPWPPTQISAFMKSELLSCSSHCLEVSLLKWLNLYLNEHTFPIVSDSNHWCCYQLFHAAFSNLLGHGPNNSGTDLAFGKYIQEKRPLPLIHLYLSFWHRQMFIEVWFFLGFWNTQLRQTL